MKAARTIILLSLLLFTNIVFSQTVSQTLKGMVFDSEIKTPLTGATVVVLGTNPLLGTTTDLDGNYKISHVPIGRYNIHISYIGYEPAIVSEILVTSGKEAVINAGLKQSVTQMKEVTVKANSQKDKPINTMASISARSFTVEETRRYAGGIDDPARLVSSFAGVTVGNLQDNAIIIRGNSPKGVSWRLEGVEIPNPNHFAGGNVVGGGFVTIFSSQLLSNSDFFTGAFPAEYGNALAGVFDMKFRNGNNEKRESTVQVGMLGIDVSSEGPFKKGKNASYLFNYRYSTLGLIADLGLLPTQQVPRYQDLSFKLNFPTQKAGVFSFWGIGAIDNNKEHDELDFTKWETDWDRVQYDWNLNTGVLGLTHKMIIGSRSYINTTLAASGIQNKMDATRLDSSLIRRPNWHIVDKSGKITLSSFINHKFSTRHIVKTGINYHTLFYNLDMNSTINNIPETFQNIVKANGYSSFSEFYIQSKYDITENFVINAGINANYFALNNDFSIDPRFSIKWEFYPKNFLSFGYGKHSQLEELKIYLINKNVNGNVEYPNKNLELSHAQHFVLGYDWLINNSTFASSISPLAVGF
ncbi:MAG: carboxypeptidase-like regulatory domain-containing protein [Paludibacter sp.]|nr:carboxypeptidase-like regulatory domain-containing protein [Paludibacter sp.]